MDKTENFPTVHILQINAIPNKQIKIKNSFVLKTVNGGSNFDRQTEVIFSRCPGIRIKICLILKSPFGDPIDHKI